MVLGKTAPLLDLNSADEDARSLTTLARCSIMLLQRAVETTC
jgi:hypothetical protein